MKTKRNFRREAMSQVSSVLDISGATTLSAALDYALSNPTIFPSLVMCIEQGSHEGMLAAIRKLVKQIKVAGKDVPAYLPFKASIAESGDSKEKEVLLWKRIELMERSELRWAMAYQERSLHNHVQAHNRLVEHVNETRPECGRFSYYGQ